MWDWITSAFSAVIKPITTVVEHWQIRKDTQLQSDVAIAQAQTEAKIKLVQSAQEADVAWENLSIQKSGWKGGYITIVFTIPAILCFVPGAVPLVQSGFSALNETPLWYQSIVGAVCASALGIKHLADFMSLKKGA